MGMESSTLFVVFGDDFVEELFEQSTAEVDSLTNDGFGSRVNEHEILLHVGYLFSGLGRSVDSDESVFDIHQFYVSEHLHLLVVDGKFLP